MSTLVIRLLGAPEIERDGVVVPPPRGHKSWAVLAYLLLAQERVGRARLAGLVFGDADDPLGALRWTLAQLRRSLGVADALRGDPLELGLPADAVVDVLALAAGDPDPALARGELLEGIEPGAGEVFETWLLVERRRFASACEAVLRGSALEALVGGAPLDAAALASRVLALNAFDESAPRAAGPLPRAVRGPGGRPRARRGGRGAVPARARPRARRARAPRGGRGRPTTARRPSAIARPRSASSRPAARPSPPARSSRASPACARPAGRRARSATRRCSRAC